MRISETHAMRMRDAFREMFRDAHQYAYDAYRNAHTKMHQMRIHKVSSRRFRDAYVVRF